MGRFVRQPEHLKATSALTGGPGGPAATAGVSAEHVLPSSSSSLVRADPPSVHFAGFRVGEKQELTLSLQNAAPGPRRITVTGLPHARPPGAGPEPVFSIRHAPRGLIAPGTAESVTIIFTPNTYS